MLRGEKMIVSLFILFAVFTLLPVVLADPSGPGNMTVVKSERRQDTTWPPATHGALAGNVTQLSIYGETVTRTWAGYFGEINGSIVLTDANNNTLYDWSVANPQGEIYAARVNSINWANIRCANSAERSAEDTAVGADPTKDEDAPSRTFLATNETDANGHSGPGHPLFYVGSVQINANSCYAVQLYNSTRQPGEFYEVLLHDGTNIVYAAILSNVNSTDNGSLGFDGGWYDFEMIVGENGHGTDTATTTYYFWIEIE